jgi:pimeloyl-ACP methyl ester carboxylesterase
MFILLAIMLGVLVGAVAFTALASAWIANRFPRVATPIQTSLGALHVVSYGPQDAPRGAALLIHGASGNFADLAEPLAAPLCAAGYRVFSVDRPGHGWSERANHARPASPEVQASMIHEAMTSQGVERALVIVHSLGGPVGLSLALNQPQFVNALALLAPVSHPWPGGVAAYFHLAVHPLIGPIFRWTCMLPIGLAHMRGALAGVFSPCPIPENYATRTRVWLALRPKPFKDNAEDVVACHGEVSQLSTRYGAIRTPVAIVTGEGDRVVYNHIHAAGCTKQIAGATLLELPGVGHSPHHSATAATMQAILALAQRAEGPRTSLSA